MEKARSSGSNTRLRFQRLLYAAILCTLTALVCPLSGCTTSESEVSDATPSDAKSTAKTNAPEQRPKGVLAPDFTLTALSGESIKLSDHLGDVVLVDFWATWCGPCRRSIPDLVSLYNDHNSEGFTVLGIALERQGTERLIPYVKESGIPYPVMLGTAAVVQSYGNITSVPTAFLIGRDGTIRRKIVGVQSRGVLERTINELLAEQAPA